MSFPVTRLRRMRSTPAMRCMVRETSLHAEDLMAPLFVVPGNGIRNEISSMPGQYQLSVDYCTEEAQRIAELGIPAVILFGIPSHKDECGSAAWDDSGIIQQAVGAIKSAVPELLITTDLCFCEYTSHGHCGVLNNGRVDNDQTLEIIARQSLSHARAGADLIAPSGMIDGAVRSIRNSLDEAGFHDVAIMSYSAKYASAFYGPFREAAQSAPQFGDRKGYQMNPANAAEALREVALDIEEGADIVMVKPALAYSDIIRLVKDRFQFPTAAYNVSGEYAMVKAAAARGWIDGERIMVEILTSLKRAGADIIITYFATEYARLLREKKIEL